MTKTTNKEWEEEFLSAWEKSYGRMIYGETGFLTKDLGTPFEIDKYLVKEFIQSLLDKQKEEIAFDFLHKLQEKAKTVPPNLLLNESVNIAWEYKLSNK